MTQYGDLIPESQEEVALAGLVRIENRITTEGGADDEIYAEILNEYGVFVSFQKPLSATLPFRRWQATEAIHTARVLMNFYGARKLPSVKMLMGKEVLSHFSVHFLFQPGGMASTPLISVSNNSEPASTDLIARSSSSLSWPPSPCTFQIEAPLHEAPLQMIIFEYGLYFTASKEEVLDRLSRIEMSIQRNGGPEEDMPSVVIRSYGVAVVFGAVRYPSLPLTHWQAAQTIHTLSSLINKYGPWEIDRAEIYVVGLRAMSFSLKGPIQASGNETLFLTLGSPSNDSAPTTPALVARSNMTTSNTNIAYELWPSLPFTFNVEENLDVTVLAYGVDFPGPRRHILSALATIAELVAKVPGRTMRTQRLSHSPVTIAFERIRGQGLRIPLLRTQATMVLHAIELLMVDYKPRELPRIEIYVGGEKAMGLSVTLYFAPVDTGNTTMEIGSTTMDTGNTTMDTGNTTIEIGNTTMEIGNTASELGSASADIGTS